jgi:dihydroflavonol-4-reductase
MIAVTGANGLLGSFIVRRLLKANERCIALRRHSSDISLLEDAGKINWQHADILDPISMEEAFKNVDVVVHAAAMVSFNPRERKKIHEVNVVGTQNVVNACLAAGVKRLIHISSVAALGRTRENPFITEDNKFIESSLNSTYAETKYLAELEVYRGQEEGLGVIVVNPSVILAPADWNKSSAKLFKYVYDQKPFYIDNNLNYVDVRDVAEAIYRLIRAEMLGEKFILNGGNIRLKDFFAIAASKMNRKPPGIQLGTSTVSMLARLEMLRSSLTGSEPLITPETAKLAGTNFTYSSEKAKNALALKFQTIDETLEWCCGHYLNYLAKN